jgi:hypothetical protein
VVFGIVLNARPARTPAQALFRFGLVGFALCGVIVTSALKFVLKRQAPAG